MDLVETLAVRLGKVSAMNPEGVLVGLVETLAMNQERVSVVNLEKVREGETLMMNQERFPAEVVSEVSLGRVM